MLGSGDYPAALGIRESPARTELDYPRAHVALAAASAGLLAIDAPFYQGMDDLDALRADVVRGRQFGYHAKAAIHPEHLITIAQILTPTAEEVGWATQVLDAYETGRQRSHGVARIGQTLIDAPIVAQARRTLRQAGP
jgi:citrate lyase beta subunit